MTIKRSTTIALTVAIAFFMQNLDTTAVNTAIPAMAKDFGTDVVHMSTGITAYLISLAVFIPVSGWIAECFGTRKVFCSSIILFIIASTLCGSSHSLGQFVFHRVLQGIAGAMMTPVGRLAVLKATAKEDLVSAMNYITVPALIAPIVGPFLGGYLTSYWSWHYVFLLNVPISVLCIILAWRLIPADEIQSGRRKRFDLVGFILSGLSFVGFMLGFDLLSKEDISYFIPICIILVSAILLYLNVKYSRHRSNPLVDYSVMRIPTYRITILTGTISRMVINVAPYLVPLMFQIGFGLSPFQSGLLFLATMVGNLGMKSATVWVINRYTFRMILIVNGILVAIFTLLTAFLLPTTPIYIIVIVMFFSGVVRSMQFTSITTLAFADTPGNKTTSANTLYSTVQQMSSGLGIALGAVALRFSNTLNNGTPGNYTVADFRDSFIIVAILAFVHLFGYLKLRPDAGNSVRKKKKDK